MIHPALNNLTTTAATLTACLDCETAAIALQNWTAMTEALEAKRDAIRCFESAWVAAIGAAGPERAELVSTLRPVWDPLDRAVSNNRETLARAITTQEAVIATVLHALDEAPDFTTYGPPPNKPIRAVALTTRV